jgi:hypothetical protein
MNAVTEVLEIDCQRLESFNELSFSQIIIFAKRMLGFLKQFHLKYQEKK